MGNKDAMLATVEITKAAVERAPGDVLVRKDEVVDFIEAVYNKIDELVGKNASSGSSIA